MAEAKKIITSSNVHLFYGKFEALKGIDLDFNQNEITALIGPSGCGKSTYLRTLNRMNDLIPVSPSLAMSVCGAITFIRPMKMSFNCENKSAWFFNNLIHFLFRFMKMSSMVCGWQALRIKPF